VAKHESQHVALSSLLGISGIALVDDGDAPKNRPAKFEITTRRKDDSVEVRAGVSNRAADVARMQAAT